MRALALAAVLAATGGGSPPPPGLYCPASGERAPIYIDRDGSVGIDGVDCRDAVVSGGRMRAARCFTNSVTDGGSPYETSLNVLPDGMLVHEMELYRRTTGPECP